MSEFNSEFSKAKRRAALRLAKASGSVIPPRSAPLTEDQLDRENDPEVLLQQVLWILGKHRIACKKIDGRFLHSLMIADKRVIPSSEVARVLNLLFRIDAIHYSRRTGIPLAPPSQEADCDG